MSATQPPAEEVEFAQRLCERYDDGIIPDLALALADIARIASEVFRPAIIAEERAATVAWLHRLPREEWYPSDVADALEQRDHEQKGPSRG